MTRSPSTGCLFCLFRCSSPSHAVSSSSCIAWMNLGASKSAQVRHGTPSRASCPTPVIADSDRISCCRHYSPMRGHRCMSPLGERTAIAANCDSRAQARWPGDCFYFLALSLYWCCERCVWAAFSRRLADGCPKWNTSKGHYTKWKFNEIGKWNKSSQISLVR